jgi:hypothetical protein
MKKAIFNSVKAYGLVNGNDNAKSFSIEYFNAIGFVSLTKKCKAFEVSKAFDLVDFENGKKPVYKAMQQKDGFITLFVAGNGVFVHVNNEKPFARKATIDNTVKNFRKVKAIVGKLLRKNNLPKSNMLQTRVCCEKVNL